MRHNKKFNHLGRTASHRNAMLSNMACSLIKHKRITTTVAKAKALKKFVEPLITRSKDDTTNSRRVVFSNLQDKYAVTELFKEISVKVADRPGGYTRIIKTGHRLGDNAEMCFIELVDYNENTTRTWLRQLPRKLLVLVVLRNQLQLQKHRLLKLLQLKLLQRKPLKLNNSVTCYILKRLCVCIAFFYALLGPKNIKALEDIVNKKVSIRRNAPFTL